MSKTNEPEQIDIPATPAVSELDFDTEINKIMDGFDALIHKPKVYISKKHVNQQFSGQHCRAIIRENQYTGAIERCNRLLLNGRCCTGDHKEYILYNAIGIEEYREVLN